MMDDATAIAAMTKERDELRGGITEPHDPGGFVGDIYYGHSEYTTLGTHRWNGSEWVKLPTETEALMGLLASARTALAAEKARVAKLVEALRPFGFADEEYDDIPDHQGVTLMKSDNSETLNLVFMSDLRRARAAITETGHD